MKNQYIQSGAAYYALNFKAASSSLVRAIVTAHYPDVEDNLTNNSTYPAGQSVDTVRWHAQLPKVTEPDGGVVLVVRDPVERFRSACAETNVTDVDAELVKIQTQDRYNNHFWPTSRLIVDGCKLYRFDQDLDEAAMALGLSLPLPNIAGTNPPKPDLTDEQLAAVQLIYADDIALYESITEAGQVYTAPPAPATEELKAAKREQLKQERDAAWQGTLMTSFGVPFHTDVQTQIDIQMMLQMLDPLEVFSGYKCADGVRRDLSREQFALALNEGVVRKVTAFAVEGAKLAAVEAATTAEELNAI